MSLLQAAERIVRLRQSEEDMDIEWAMALDDLEAAVADERRRNRERVQRMRDRRRARGLTAAGREPKNGR